MYGINVQHVYIVTARIQIIPLFVYFSPPPPPSIRVPITTTYSEYLFYDNFRDGISEIMYLITLYFIRGYIL